MLENIYLFVAYAYVNENILFLLCLESLSYQEVK